MTTVYFTKQDYREAMRDPHGSPRSHAICRRLTGCASVGSPWYGAHYWVASAVLGATDADLAEQLRFFRGSFARELTKCNSDELPPRYAALWRLALRRVLEIQTEAEALPHSMVW
jgi:hypothetical protein